jgi:hypothetical protein
MFRLIYSSSDADPRLMAEILNGLGSLNTVHAKPNTSNLPSNWKLTNINDAHTILSKFYIQEAQEMDEDEPFVARYRVGKWDEGEHILACDVELSTPGVEGRTYYGRGAIRIGPDEYIVDLEGITDLEVLLGS